jgi:uncharacterized phage protein (TIGR02218 family)
LVKFTRPDGLIYGFTTHDRNLAYLGLTYNSGQESTDLTDLTHTSALAVDDATASGLLNSTVTQEEIEAGKWSGSEFLVYRVNWQDLTQGHELLGAGELGEVTHNGQTYKVEFMSRLHKLGRVITRHFLPTCDADLGDERCGVDIEPLAVTDTVTGVTTNRQFEASALPSVDHYHDYGRLLWLTGLNAGRAIEVKEQIGGDFELQLSMYYAITIGDTFKAYPGCNKLLRTGLDEYLGDCKIKFSNVVNFRGFDLIPGIDKILRPADAP